ncbi:thermonuclease family protein [Halioxenophilus sp. WMMB6]|uniref:thermonuclease family protein n=1 Tax=Halioxenophilus sp. WMMB6 TaxID=3073815 RepID=UPI00295F40CF|nr:thermonuclease family protein [Halioxenophilus sp. WMMB6]
MRLLPLAVLATSFTLSSFTLSTSANGCAENLPKSYGHVTVDQVVGVYDGDTITVTVENWPSVIGDAIGVRVAGVDTPEIRGKCASEKALARSARELTRTAVTSASKVELYNLRRDKYFRLLADVCVDGKNLSKLLLEAGLAYAYDGGTKQSWCGEG